ncbi:hypothetical protein [Achromobacter aloeverae]|uniref:hypothetical protein n=1 Tax=Achromobacter aloeverae TaxID=1750518 RepID=UPI00100DF8A2|nr:hypothetical protein [Achromobacter aloeverae]
MTNKYTPGPWRVINGGAHWNNPDIPNYRIHAPNSERAYDIAYSGIGELVAEHVYELEDARLISAAPELLEALIAMEREKSDYMKQNSLGDPALETTNIRARVAIAKATGENNG